MIKRITLAFCLILPLLSFGQDPKFSQYFAAPMVLNPALIGYFNGPYRVSIHTRQQWANIGDSYNTYSVSGELKFQDEFDYDDIFTLAAGAVLDESFNKILKSYNYSIGASYYKYIDPDHNFSLGIAPQISYVSKSVDYDALTFASQYENGSFNMSLPNHLDLSTDKVAYFDFNVGINLAMSLEKVSASIGYGSYHLGRPTESLVNNLNAKLPLRHTLNMSFRYATKDLVDFNLGAHFLFQGSSTDQIIGGIVGVKPVFESKVKFNAGVWYKANENTVFPYVGFEAANLSLGVNYSVFTKSITSYQPRTFEISLILTDRNALKYKNICKF